MTEPDCLWVSFHNAVRAGHEADTLMLEVETLLTEPALGFEVGDVDEGSLPNEDAYAYTYYWRAFSLRAKRNSPRFSHLGTVTFAISFWREEDGWGNDWPGCHAAKFYVAFDPLRPDAENHWEATSLFVDGRGNTLEGITAVQPFLWVYGSEQQHTAWQNQSWFFCLPLLKLESPDDLRREALNPLCRLLRGDAQEQAFADAQSCYRSSW